MFKGLFKGSLSGLFIGGFAVVGLSVVAEQPAGNAPPSAPQVSAPLAAQDTANSETNLADVAAALPDAVQSELPSEQNGALAAAVPIAAPDVPAADTAPLDPPIATQATQVPASPNAIPEPPRVVAMAEEPVLPNPQSIAPQVPTTESDIVVTTTPAAPPPPVVVDTSENESEAGDAPTEIAIEVSNVAPDAAPELPAIVTPDATSDTFVIATIPDATPLPSAGIAPQISTPATTNTQVPVVDTQTADPTIEVAQASDVPTQPTVVTLIGEGETAALPSGTANVRVNRFGQSAQTPAAPEPEVVDSVGLPDDAPALKLFAAPFDNPEAKPTLSVVLIDDGSFGDAVPAISGIPFPVTVMLDPGADGAGEKMAAYRAAGVEVGIAAQLPQGATATDMLVYFEGAFARLPETVAVLDVSGAALQGDVETIQAAMEVIAEDGRGFLTVSQGLNTALREAEKSGVPSAVVFRDLDAEGQDGRVIRRFMDQAAFRARQDTGVIMLGRVRADTISALIVWGTANRAEQVAVVPVSHVLLSQNP